jgi:hypothetical protein
MDPFTPRANASAAVPDPSKHVNFTLGMVLGVDDFTQEFAYLSGRDQWLARDLIGYGTAWGLRVRVETDVEKGPRVLVEPGVAVSPRGQLIRVAPAQCAYLNTWLRANRAELEKHLISSSPPGSATTTVYLVLCYRDCATDMVPIPGEPCRSEEEAVAPSRLADDFRLELRFAAPNQQEEDAVRDFVAWLAEVEVVETGGSTLEEFLAAVRAASHLWESPPASPVESPPADFMFGSPPPSLSIPAGRCREYLRAAFRVWVTELRPRWRPDWFDTPPCCEEHAADKKQPNEECLLLAELDVPLVHVALNDEWKVSDTNQVLVNEERRPYLIHLRLLQEWLLYGRTCAGSQAGAQGPKGEKGDKGDRGDSVIVAAGKFDANGEIPSPPADGEFSSGGLVVTRNTRFRTLYLLRGRWFSQKSNYVVKGTPIARVREDTSVTPGQVFEVIGLTREEIKDLSGPAGGFGLRAGTSPHSVGIVVRLMHLNATESRTGFMVEISRFRA